MSEDLALPIRSNKRAFALPILRAHQQSIDRRLYSAFWLLCWDAHEGHSANHAHNHVVPERLSSRRDFLRSLMGRTLAGASMVELAWHRAAWARAAAPGSDARLFDVHKAAEGVFLAQARPQAMVNCNAVVFVRSKDVVVVDAHGMPSASAALIYQLNREVTSEPVRYVINTHFHGDHTQGNRAYRASGRPMDFISSTTTKELISDLGPTPRKGLAGCCAGTDRGAA